MVIIAFFAILIPFWVVLNKQVKITKQIQKVIGILTAKALRIPQGLFFSRNHTWTYMEKSGIAKVGLDDLILHITGEVRFNHLKKAGENIHKGDLLAEIEHDGKLLRVYSPVSGEIMDTNSVLNKSPESVNEDPYGNGWIYKLKPSNWIAEINSYYLGEEATNWSSKELERFKDFVAISVEKYTPEPSNIILQDGGELRDHTLSELPNEVWQDFQKNFLSSPV